MTHPVETVIVWFVENTGAFTFVVATSVSGVWWALHRTFATHKSQQLCKTELMKALKEHEIMEHRELAEQTQQNATQHMELYHEIGYVRKDVSELKNLLINLSKEWGNRGS